MAIDNLMEICDFELKGELDPVRGSWWQKLIFWSKDKTTQTAVNRMLQTLKEVFVARSIGVPSAEETMKLTEAVDKVIKSLEPFEAGVIRLGKLLVVKGTLRGKSVLRVETISLSLAQKLADNPQLINMPQQLLLLIEEPETANQTPPIFTPSDEPQRYLSASITASATPIPAVPGKSTITPAEEDVTGLSQTLNRPDGSASRYDFFIAYATSDRRKAQDLCWLLQDASCKVFLDVENLKPGALWPPALREALEASSAVVVLVSTHANEAFYHQEEIVRAIQLARDKPRAHTIIPVILEQLPQGAMSMPYGLSGWQAQDATQPGGLKRVAADLVAWLNDHQLDAK
jgi:hypothetical protein